MLSPSTLEIPIATREKKILTTVGLYFIQCMDKVCPPAGLHSLTAGVSFIQMNRVHLGFTGRVSVIQMDKVYPPAGLQGLTAGLYFLPCIGVYSIQMV